MTQEEKIDYIYETLKKNERKAKIGFIFTWGFRILLVGYLIYFLTTGLPNMLGNILPSFGSLSNLQMSGKISGNPEVNATMDSLRKSEVMGNPAIKSLIDSFYE